MYVQYIPRLSKGGLVTVLSAHAFTDAIYLAKIGAFDKNSKNKKCHQNQRKSLVLLARFITPFISVDVKNNVHQQFIHKDTLQKESVAFVVIGSAGVSRPHAKKT
jgi:hypothetical protein